MVGSIRKSVASIGMAVVIGTLPFAASAQEFQQQGCVLQIFFETGVTSLNPGQANAVEAFLNGASTDNFAVQGYASTSGDPAVNLQLSQTRAQNAAALIQSQGALVSAAALGEGGDGPVWQRADILRDDCAGPLIDQATEVVVREGPGLGAIGAVGAGVGLLILLGLAGSSSDGT